MNLKEKSIEEIKKDKEMLLFLGSYMVIGFILSIIFGIIVEMAGGWLNFLEQFLT